LETFYKFLENNSIYIVLFIVLVIWFGIFVHLWNTDKKLKQIEKEIKEIKQNEK